MVTSSLRCILAIKHCMFYTICINTKIRFKIYFCLDYISALVHLEEEVSRLVKHFFLRNDIVRLLLPRTCPPTIN